MQQVLQNTAGRSSSFTGSRNRRFGDGGPAQLTCPPSAVTGLGEHTEGMDSDGLLHHSEDAKRAQRWAESAVQAPTQQRV